MGNIHVTVYVSGKLVHPVTTQASSSYKLRFISLQRASKSIMNEGGRST